MELRVAENIITPVGVVKQLLRFMAGLIDL